MSDYPFWPLNKQRLNDNYIHYDQKDSSPQNFGVYHKKSLSSRNIPLQTLNLRQSLYQQEHFTRPFQKRQFLTQRENKFDLNEILEHNAQQRKYNFDWIEFGRQNTISNRRQQSQQQLKDSYQIQHNKRDQSQMRKQRIEIDILKKDKEIQQIEIDQLEKRLKNRDKSLGKLNQQYFDLRDTLYEYEKEIKHLRQKLYEQEDLNKILESQYEKLKDKINKDNTFEQNKKDFCESMYQKYLPKSPLSEEKPKLENKQLEELYDIIQQHYKSRKIIKIAEQREILSKIKNIKIEKQIIEIPKEIPQQKDDDQKLIEVNQKLLEIIDHFKIWEDEDQQNLSEDMEHMNLQLVNIIYNQVMSGDNSSHLSKSKQPSFQIESEDQNDNIQVTEEEYNKLDQIFNEENDNELEQELQIKNNQVQDLKEALLQQSEQIEELQEEKKILEVEINNQNQEIETLNQRVEETQDQLRDQMYQEQQLQEYKKQITNLEEENKLINMLQEELEEKEKTQKKFDQICIDHAKTINDLYEQLEQQKNLNLSLEKKLVNKNFNDKPQINPMEDDSYFPQKKILPQDITSRSLDNMPQKNNLSFSGNFYCFSQFNANYEFDEENSILADKYLQVLLHKVHQRSQEIKKLQDQMQQQENEFNRKMSDLENQKINNQKLKIQIYQMEQLKEENIIVKRTNEQLRQELENLKKQQKDSDTEKFSVDDDAESDSVIYEKKSQIIQDKTKNYSDIDLNHSQMLQQNMDDLKNKIQKYLNSISSEQKRDAHPLKEMMIKLDQYLLLFKDHKQKYEKRIAVIKNTIEKLNIIKKVENMNIKLKEQQERNQERITKLKDKLSQLNVDQQEDDDLENIVLKYKRDLQVLEKEQNDYANNILQLEDYLQENKTGQSLDEVQNKSQKLQDEYNRDVSVLFKLVNKLREEFSHF